MRVLARAGMEVAQTRETTAEEKIQNEKSPAEEHPFGAPPKDLPRIDLAPPSRVESSPGVEIEVIDLANKSDRKRFLNVAAPLYKGDPNYIEPLRIERMQFLDTKNNPGLADLEVHALLAHKNGKTVGRITAHVDHAYDRYHDVRAGWFGFFECIDDRAVAHALLKKAIAWLEQKGAQDVIGPCNFNTNHQVGLLVENFSRPPSIEMTYNPPYYEELLTSYGLKKAKDLYAWWIDVSAPLENPKVQRIAKLAERIKKREGVTIRNARKKDFHQEVERIFSIYNESWVRNWGFVPVNRAEFDHLANSIKPIMREELMLIVEVDGRAVGFAITLPDINQIVPKDGRLFPFGWLRLLLGLKKISLGRLMALGMAPEYRKRGLESLLFLETAVRCQKIGINYGEIGWTLEDNVLINRAVESMDGKLNRKYRLFGAIL